MTKTKQEIEALIDSTLVEEFRHFDLNPYGERVNVKNSESPDYVLKHKHEYIRTLLDVLQFAESRGSKRVLEIGAFFGMVSICLAKLGFRVYAADIPEYMSMPEQKERFSRHGIEISEVRLQDYILPFRDDRFDVIIMCEVLEHLNFNPLPLIKEINRVGAPGSLFYLSLPNLAYYRNRLKLLFGRPILHSIQGYFDQLDPNALVIVNGHWREYTGPEIVELLRRMGYEIERQYYFSIADTLKRPSLKNRLTRLVFRMIPSFKENQTTLAIRKQRTDVVFTIPKTVHESLEVL
jgi:SAM-dependent methyltransferase